jgi:hypothetical protein
MSVNAVAHGPTPPMIMHIDASAASQKVAGCPNAASMSTRDRGGVAL